MASSYTEFYCRSSGSNSNAGSTDSDTPFKTYTNGSWNASTGVFTPASGNPSSDGVTTGMWANIAGTYSGRITAVTSTNFTVSLTVFIGTSVPATGTRTAIIGGRWKGPNAADGWPFNAQIIAATDSSSNPTRINLYNNASYSISAAISVTGINCVIQGMTSSPGDGGRATLTNASGASFNLMTVSGSVMVVRDMIFDTNGATGTADGIQVTSGTGGHTAFQNCIFKNMKGRGLLCQGTGGFYVFDRCEFTGNGNVGAGSSSTSAVIVAYHCVFHDNAGGISAKNIVAINSIFDTLTTNYSINVIGTSGALVVLNCDFFKGAVSQIYGASGTSNRFITLQNCNLFDCDAYGIQVVTGSGNEDIVQAIKCAYGSGTYANTSGNYTGNVDDTSPVTYTSNQTPWSDPENGVFTLTAGTACENGGYVVFVQTTGSYGPTVAYADIGAAGFSGSGSGGLKTPRTFSGF